MNKANGSTQIITIAHDRIRPDPNQPRQHFDQAEIAELRQSIREHGLLQPLLVRHEPSRFDGSPYLVVAGERRWHACAGVLDDIPCIVRDATPEQAQELALVENIQRANLTPIEEARGIASLMEANGLSQNATAKRLHKHVNWVRNRLALLKIAADAQEVAAVAPDKMTALVEIDTIRDDNALRGELLEMAARGTSHSAIMERIDAHREKQRPEAESRRAPDEQTQQRTNEQARSGSGQMSRGRMVTGTPHD